jgi:ADP-ribosylglycohydrolase
MAITLHSRIRGCLLGGAVGDALGAPVEFLSLAEIRARYGPDGITDFDEAYGTIGAVTDDTQMTLFTAEGLLRAMVRQRERGIAHAPSVVHHAYLRWLHTQGEASQHALFDPRRFDGWLIREERLFARRAPGLTCISALEGREQGRTDAPLNDSKGCGGVMRVAPVGLLAAPDRAFDLGCEVAAVTHGHPSGYLAAGALALIIANVVRGSSLGQAVEMARSELSRRPDSEECIEAIRQARLLAERGVGSPEKLETLGGGWVAEEALAISVYCGLVSTDSFERGIILSANHSGDTDSTAAITGNILGAVLGEEAIPERWRDQVELAEVVLSTANDLHDAATGNREPEWGRYPGW